jgi:hypothetical protein
MVKHIADLVLYPGLDARGVQAARATTVRVMIQMRGRGQTGIYVAEHKGIDDTAIPLTSVVSHK